MSLPKNFVSLPRTSAINPPCPNCGEPRVSLDGRWVCKDCTRVTTEAVPVGAIAKTKAVGELFLNRAARRVR